MNLPKYFIYVLLAALCILFNMMLFRIYLFLNT